MARLPMRRDRVPTKDRRTVKPKPKVAADFYSSPEWRAVRAEVIAERGAVCQRPGCMHGGRLYVDHIKELRDGGAPLDKANLELLCASCHTSKTAQSRRVRAFDIYGDETQD